MREESKTAFCRVFVVGFAAMLLVALVPATGHAQFKPNSKNLPQCQKLGSKMQGSSGMQMYCFGAQQNGAAPQQNGAAAQRLKPSGGGGGGFVPNVNAANVAEDINQGGVRVFGQSETSIAAAGPYVVEAWNDSTGFFSVCGSPNNKEELTGFAFSNNGGQTFTDMGGLPNLNCANSLAEGDPSVEVYQAGGNTYFYISSIFIPFNLPENAISVTACQVIGSGTSATLSCGQPILAAVSSDCFTFFPGFTACSFLDKDFLSIDATRGRLYLTYTEFGISANFNGQIELGACDLTANPAAPTCSNGSLASGSGAPAYEIVAPGDNVNFCELEGAYPAVDPSTGDAYVAYEFNWSTNFLSFACAQIPTKDALVRVPGSCLTFPTASCGPSGQTAVNIVSLDLAFIPGYNRFPANDFPRIAVSDSAGTVSIVWNDSGVTPLGDILMQSYFLGSLAPVQSAPVKLNNDGTSALHFMPAVRNSDRNGLLSVSWFDRRLNPNTALTDVYAAVAIDPRITTTPKSNSRVTNLSSNWSAVSSDITPNFGDYTDNYVFNTSGKHGSSTLFVAWSDGRLGDPQPFEAHSSH